MMTVESRVVVRLSATVVVSVTIGVPDEVELPILYGAEDVEVKLEEVVEIAPAL